jgi:hypothetical protein
MWRRVLLLLVLLMLLSLCRTGMQVLDRCAVDSRQEVIVGGICGCGLPALIICGRTGDLGRDALRSVSGCAVDLLSVGYVLEWRPKYRFGRGALPPG